MTASQNLPLCVDGRMLGGGGTGVATYARAVADAQRVLSARNLVLDACPRDRPGRLRRWTRALSPAALPARLDRERLLAPDLFRVAQVHFDLYGRLLTVRPPFAGGVMHWTYPLPLRLAGWRNVYTIHDAIPLTRPALSPIDPRRHRRLLRRLVEAADALVTVSNAARREIAGALDLPADRLVDCSQPVTPDTSAGPPPAGLAPGSYLLALGSVEPRKNIARLLDAYAASGVGLPLVVAGPATARNAVLERAIAAAAGIVRLAYVDPADKAALIVGARALLMPSLAEGFGLPVAEAMALGTPVIASDRGAVAETAGGAALAVDPEDVAAIAAAIRRIATDDAERRRLAEAGRANAARFTPAAFADRLGALYAGLVAAPPRGR